MQSREKIVSRSTKSSPPTGFSEKDCIGGGGTSGILVLTQCSALAQKKPLFSSSLSSWIKSTPLSICFTTPFFPWKNETRDSCKTKNLHHKNEQLQKTKNFQVNGENQYEYMTTPKGSRITKVQLMIRKLRWVGPRLDYGFDRPVGTEKIQHTIL